MDRLTLHGELMPSATFARDGLLDSSIDTFTVNAGTDVITVASSHGLSAGDQVRFSTTGTLPAPLSINTVYYVLSSGLTTTDLKVSTSPGGSVVDITNTGSGTHTIWKNGKWFELQAGFGYQGSYAAIDDVPSGLVGVSEFQLSDGFIGHAYSVIIFGTLEFTASLLSGTLPPGLTLTQPDPTQWEVSGTPTTLGDYDFVI